MAFKPNEITAEHILAAVAKIEREQLILTPSTRWLVEIEGKQYPPKEIMRLAHEQMNGERIWEYGGGNATNKFLEKFGYQISEKESPLDFYSFVEELKQSVEEDESIKDKFLFNETEKNYVWIGDVQNKIGNARAHYELSFEKEKYFVDVHFEDEHKLKFGKLAEEVKPPLKSFKWFDARSIAYGNGISVDEPNAIDEVKKQLLYLENTLGNEIRAIMNNMDSTSNNKVSTSLNQILFGPPGTGKTFNTINKALEIIGENIEGKTRKDVKALFDQKIKEGQIVFTTFHQSMSYEDFIEGIKPLKPLTDDKFVKYDIQPGIFYTISEKAKSNFQNSKLENKGKLSFEEAFEKFKEEWEKKPDMKFPLKTEGYDFTIIGFTNTSIQFKKASGGTSHTLSIATLKELYYGKEFDFKQGVGIYSPSVLKKVQSYKKEESEEVLIKNYVIIIDEINRGNVSQIFGELITLIEEDKRIGNNEALEATLPYSKESFGVPPNLYIIGTMNTADRSVEALDAALRRRFSFEEMPPRPELLAPSLMLQRLWLKYEKLNWSDPEWKRVENNFIELHGAEILERKQYEDMEALVVNENAELAFDEIIRYQGINLEILLRTINKRIVKLLDKDHQIGHSYFISVNSISDLKFAFKNKIIPLLQEYFFGDYGKIGLVLGSSFVKKEEGEDIFSDFDKELASDYSDKISYSIENTMAMGDDDFKIAIMNLLK